MSYNPERLRACWEVTAGVLPGKSDEKYHKRFLYTDKQFEEDTHQVEREGYRSHYLQRMEEAMEYAQALQQPAHLNWVNVYWLWL